MHRNLLERGTNLQQFRKASFLCVARGRLSNFSSTVQNLCKKRKFVFGRLLILAAPGLKFHGSEILFIYFSLFFFLSSWYFGKIKRIEAEKKLLLPDNEHGAFLIRDSESRRNDYSLSGKSCCY